MKLITTKTTDKTMEVMGELFAVLPEQLVSDNVLQFTSCDFALYMCIKPNGTKRIQTSLYLPAKACYESKMPYLQPYVNLLRLSHDSLSKLN